MKILAIRGENLASLHGKFELDLAGAPLDRAGLFAITGPTGAGKSTLLDAICLALYGTTPRIEGVAGRGHEFGREGEENRLSNTDERAILRKGTAEGFAEVEFVGRDGKRYRARWSVRRARGKIDGRVQNSTAQLWDESGDAIGKTPSDVKRCIEQRVGLSYPQFCRSVLLAQGEFARFLQATEKDRAELLERVTGSEIYRELSVAAHERYAKAKQALAELQREQQGVEILTSEDRARLELLLAERDEARRKAQEALQAAAEAVRWHELGAQLARAVSEGEAAVSEAEASWAAAGPRREALAAVERLLPLRPAIEAADAGAAEAERAEKALSATKELASKAAAHRDGAREALVAAQALADAERLRREAAAPALESAKRLDVLLDGARRVANESREGAEKAARAVAAKRAEVASLRESVAGEEAIVAAAVAWLDAHRHLAPAAEQWDRWLAELQRQVNAQRNGERAAARLSAVLARIAALRGQEDALRVAAEGAGASLRGAEELASLAEGAASSVPRSELRVKRDELAALDKRTAELATVAEAALRNAAEEVSFREEAAAAAAEEAGLRERIAELGAREKLLAEQLAEGEMALADARAALDLSEHRAGLRPGEACPLCGSLEHPWAVGAIAVAERVRERSERVSTLRDALAVASRELAQGQAQRVALERQIATAQRGADAKATLGAELLRRWTAGATGLQLPASPTDPAAAQALAQLRRTLAESVQELLVQEREADRLDEAAAAARREATNARKLCEERETELRDLLQGLERLAGDEREARAVVEAEARVAAAALANLEPVLEPVAGWRASLVREPDRFVQTLGAEVEAWRRRNGERQEAEARLGTFRVQKDREVALLGTLESDAQERSGVAGARARELAELQGQRAALLGGESVAIFEGRLRQAESEAAQLLERARSAEATAENELARAGAAVDAAADALQRAVDRLAHLLAERDAALASLCVGLDEARAGLAQPPAVVDGWRRELSSLDKARERAASVLGERRDALSKHVASGAPDLDLGGALAARDEAKLACDRTETEYHDTRNRLANDDQARARHAAILPRIEAAQSVAKRWETMHGLIGSASGDKFQLFAQSLTLDALLGHANVHLEQLSPRYRLERVPGHDLQLQVVDRDLGDEIRAVNSLSGGETFLVSLALALGLSGLSSRTTQVESLFIDEGFGTLDPQTLDMALATLDALQATGRKVGIISHVQGLSERIGVQVQVLPQGSGRSHVKVVVR